MVGRRDRRGRGRTKIKDVVAAGLAKIGPTATVFERVALKVETILDAYIEAEEIPIRLRRRDDAGEGTDSFIEKIIDRVLGSVEAVITIPFEDEDTK